MRPACVRTSVPALSDGNAGQGTVRGPRAVAARFLNEARSVNKVSHPGLINIFEYGEAAGGLIYIAMELLEGQPLDVYIAEKGRVPVVEAVAIARQSAAALAAAHAQGVIHRDLKPANIFVFGDPESQDGLRAKILDFGIAKLVQSLEEALSVVTATGSVLGTPAYMAPEQWKNLAGVSDKADVYSLGIILFESLVGKLPFDGTPLQLMYAHMEQAPPQLRERAPWVPPPICELVQRMLAKNPDERPTMRDVDQTLRPPRRNTASDLVAGAAYVVGGGGGGGEDPAAITGPNIDALATTDDSLVPVRTTGDQSNTVAAHAVTMLDPKGAGSPSSNSLPRHSGRSQSVSIEQLPSGKIAPLSPSSAAAGEAVRFPEPAPPAPAIASSRRRPWIALAAVAVLGMTAVAVAVRRGPPSPPPPSTAPVLGKPDDPNAAGSSSTNVPATRNPGPAAKPSVLASPKLFWKIRTQPSGAQVVRVADGLVLGVTPWIYDQEPGGSTVNIRLSLPGYLDRELEWAGAADSEVEINLEKNRKLKKAGKPGSTPSLPKKSIITDKDVPLLK